MKKVRRSRRDGRETQPGCTSPIRLQTSVRVGVCESKSETVTLRGGGAASVPFFKQASPGRNMNNNDSGNAACKNQTNIPTFFWLLSSAQLFSALKGVFIRFCFYQTETCLLLSYIFMSAFVKVGRSGSIPSAISSNSLWVNGKMCVFHCVCLCVRASGCHIRIRMCVMSDVVGVDDYAVTPAVNPSDKLGGMNTCDHLRARQHLGNHITYTHRSITCKQKYSIHKWISYRVANNKMNLQFSLDTFCFRVKVLLLQKPDCEKNTKT